MQSKKDLSETDSKAKCLPSANQFGNSEVKELGCFA